MSYRPDPDDNTKMSPKGLPKKAFGNATTPAKEVIQERPTSIVINPTADATFAFCYETTASFGKAIGLGHENWITGSNIMADGGSLSLPIQPVAWRRTDAAGVTGDITFIYRGGL